MSAETPDQHVEVPVPEEAVRAAERYAVSDDGPIVQQTWGEDEFRQLLKAAAPFIAAKAERGMVAKLVDGWAEGNLCPAAQDTADAIAAKAVQQVRDRLRGALLNREAVEAADDGYECGEASMDHEADDLDRMRDALECAWNVATDADPIHRSAALDQEGDGDGH